MTRKKPGVGWEDHLKHVLKKFPLGCRVVWRPAPANRLGTVKTYLWSGVATPGPRARRGPHLSIVVSTDDGLLVHMKPFALRRLP